MQSFNQFYHTRHPYRQHQPLPFYTTPWPWLGVKRSRKARWLHFPHSFQLIRMKFNVELKQFMLNSWYYFLKRLNEWMEIAAVLLTASTNSCHTFRGLIGLDWIGFLYWEDDGFRPWPSLPTRSQNRGSWSNLVQSWCDDWIRWSLRFDANLTLIQDLSGVRKWKLLHLHLTKFTMDLDEICSDMLVWWILYSFYLVQ